tara:strand:+ start:1249 stop:1797 length:549 start_codon:yes stop_codon:yes gene_type:complete
LRAVIFLGFYLIFTNSNATEKSEIIKKLNTINNIQFKFTQKTNEKREKGECILVFPGKLKCNYKDKNKKQLIVNRKMMAITQKRYNKTFLYPLSKSAFINILNKKELIEIINVSETTIDDYFNIVFIDTNNTKTLIRFDKNNFLLAGWLSSDQYNNIVIFEIEITSINQMVDDNIFTLPSKG